MSRPAEATSSTINIQQLRNAIEQIEKIILGKPQQIKLAITCLLSNGHLLIEDQPGVGKTTLAHALAHVMGLDFNRIQFTSDLLPGDVIGVSIFDQNQHHFSFHPGPIFSHFILADEVNRATPKTQSALLEAMEEHQITIDGETRPLPEPFFVIATQNPSQQIGTYDLPESQLDRFLMKIDLGYPDKEAERELLLGDDKRKLLNDIKPFFKADEILALQQHAKKTHVSESVLDYIQAILALTRQSDLFENGLSPRGGIALLNAAKTYSWLDGLDYVLPEHVKDVLPSVVNHRLNIISHDSLSTTQDPASYIIDNITIT